MSSPFRIPTDTPGRLAILARPRGGDWLQDDIAEWKRAGVRTAVSLLTTDENDELELFHECEKCEHSEIEFVSFPISDRGLPDDSDAFGELAAELAAQLLAGRSVGIHCRIGIGRSPLLAIAVLMVLGVPATDAIPRASAARGRPVPETAEQLEWISRFSPPALAAAGAP